MYIYSIKQYDLGDVKTQSFPYESSMGSLATVFFSVIPLDLTLNGTILIWNDQF